MIIPLKTRAEVSDELGYALVKTFLRHLAKKGVILPKRDRLTPCDQKRIYEALWYPDKWTKAMYEKY